MRSTCSVYVDVGYLVASAATRVAGASLRGAVNVKYDALVESLVETAEEMSGLPVLRVHWYDSADNGVPDAQQQRIGEIPRVKLRLGRFGVDGQQKGVDLRIGLDLVAHARNGASDVFFLVSGDDDLTEAVEEAQVHGVEVVVVAVPNAADKPHGISRHLLRAADRLQMLPNSAIDKSVLKVEVPRPVQPDLDRGAPALPAAPTPNDIARIARPRQPEPAAVLAYAAATGQARRITSGYEDPSDYDEQLDGVINRVLTAYRQSASPAEIGTLRAAKPSIPRDIDRALILDASEALDMYDVSEPIRFRLRDRFWERFEDGD
jgi:hypothetical protein